MLEVLREIDTVTLNFSNEGKHLLNACIAFIMFGVALGLKAKDFKELIKSPRPALVGILSQFLFMPMLTCFLAILLQGIITPTVGLGMVLVAACPGGNISNFICSLSKGNVALSVSLTAFSSLGGLLLTPFNFVFWGTVYLQYGATAGASSLVRELSLNPLDVLSTMVIILGVPIALGMLFAHKFPAQTLKIRPWISRFSIVAFIAIIVAIFTANFDLFVRYIQYIFLIVLVHNALALSLGYFTAKSFRLGMKERKTIAIETGIQNSGLALALLFDPNIFPPEMQIGGMAFIAAWWGVWHIISGLTLAALWSRRSKSQAVALD